MILLSNFWTILLHIDQGSHFLWDCFLDRFHRLDSFINYFSILRILKLETYIFQYGSLYCKHVVSIKLGRTKKSNSWIIELQGRPIWISPTKPPMTLFESWEGHTLIVTNIFQFQTQFELQIKLNLVDKISLISYSSYKIDLVKKKL